jgi:hypothetical protein
MFVSLAPIPLWQGYMRLARWIESRSAAMQRIRDRGIARYGESRYSFIQRWVGFAGMLLWSLAFTMHYSSWVAGKIRNGHRRSVQVVTQAGSIEGPMIGSTAQFVFVFDAGTQQTRIIPVEGISQIIVDSRRRSSPK